MPELPEVETVRRMLDPLLQGRRVRRIDILRPDFIESGRELVPQFHGAELRHLWRRGKFLFLDTDAGLTAMMHLGMTGHLRVAAPNEPLVKHTHAVWHFERGGPSLHHADPRRFGRLAFYPTDRLKEDSPFGRLGADALTVKRREFREALQSRDRMLKALLLDQSVIAGLGNIYIDESLFLAGLNPKTSSGRLTGTQCDNLWTQIKEVLKASIKAGGSTVNTYRRPNGLVGWYQLNLWVYARKGQPCRKCNTPITTIQLSARTSPTTVPPANPSIHN